MSALRLIGLLGSLALFAFIFWQYRRRRYCRGEFLLGVLIVGSLAAVSIFPDVVNRPREIFRVPTRLMALSILANLTLFALVLYVLRELSSVRRSMGELVRALAQAEYDKTHDSPAQSGVAVVIPAFNEEEGLRSLLPNLPGQVCGSPLSALVIVDGARDGSVAVAHHYAARVTSHAINRGQGDALRTGFELALKQGADVVVTMDADGQHSVDEMERLVAPIVEDKADLVLGSRFLGRYDERGGSRHLGIVLFSAVMSLLSRTRITDCTNGFRAIRASALAKLELRESQFDAPELIMEALNKRLRVMEVPVTVAARQEGRSKKPQGWRYPVGFARVIVRTWLRS